MSWTHFVEEDYSYNLTPDVIEADIDQKGESKVKEESFFSSY